jgi:hypothetical protein
MRGDKIMLNTFLSTIGAVIVTLGIFKIWPTILTNLFREVHKHRNSILLEDIKKEHQVQLEDIKSDLNNKLEEVKMNYQKDIEIHKNHLLDIARYSEYQFKLYNELWASLFDLKYEAENLWKHATLRNMQLFAKQLYETKRKVGQNILLIRSDHYKNLVEIIDAFEQFRVGKNNLITIRNHRISVTSIIRVDREVQEITESNREIKNQYSTLLDRLSVEFKNHVSRSTSMKEEQLEFVNSSNINDGGSLLRSST